MSDSYVGFDCGCSQRSRGDLYLPSITSVDKDFLKETTIGGDLYLKSLTLT